MQGKLLKSTINILFTLLICFVIAIVCIESKSIINKKIGQVKILSSKLDSYKIHYKDEKLNNEFYSISQSSNFKGYEKTPNMQVKSLVNHQDIPEDEQTYILKRQIIKNPLIKDYYTQIGIFASKDIVEEVVKILYLKGILNENFTSYIETREVNNKIIYLVEVGSFNEKRDAVQFCDNLAKISIGCIVIE